MGDQAEETPEQLVSRLMPAIGGEGAWVTRWVVIAEVLDVDDGKRSVWYQCSDDVQSWDLMGMMDQVRLMEETEQIVEQVVEHMRDL